MKIRPTLPLPELLPSQQNKHIYLAIGGQFQALMELKSCPFRRPSSAMRLFCILLLVGFTVMASQNWFEHQAALQQAATLHNASLHKVVSMFSPATVPPLG